MDANMEAEAELSSDEDMISNIYERFGSLFHLVDFQAYVTCQ